MKHRLRSHMMLCLILASVGSAALGSPDAVTLIVGGKPVILTPAPTVSDGTVYAPLSLLSFLGAKAKTDTRHKQDGQKVEITPADGRKFGQGARLIGGELMLPIRQIAEKLGAVADWDERAKTLSLRARIGRMEFDGSRLRIVTSYPVSFGTLDDSKWKPPNKVILDLYGVHMPADPSQLDVKNKSDLPIRTGSRDGDQTGRIVIDMPGPVKYGVVSPPNALEITVAISGSIPDRATTDPGTAHTGPPNVAQTELPPASIQDVSCRARGPTQAEVYVAAGGPVRYTSSVSHEPDRLVVDILNAVLTRQFPEMRVGRGLLQKMRVGQVGQAVRLTMDLGRTAGYSIRQDGSSGKLVISLDLPKGAGGRLADKVVAIDPGHGGLDRKPPGCFGLLEKNCTLDIARRVQASLTKAGARVIMTRDADVYVGLAERALIAERDSADFFISIHCNAAETRTGTANGTETYYHGLDPSGQVLAACIHPEVVRATGLRDRSVKPDTTMWETGFGVLRTASNCGIPAILIEVGFLDNTGDAGKIADPDTQEAVAEAIVRGLKVYVEGGPASPPGRSGTTSDNQGPGTHTPAEPRRAEPAKEVHTPPARPAPSARPAQSEASSGPHRPGQRR